MLTLGTTGRIWVCVEAVDGRKSFDGLAALVSTQLKRDPLSGDLFVFKNRRGDRLKILAWQGDGFALYGLSNPDGFFYRVFGWGSLFLGGVPVVRFTHHVLTWAILIFVPIHIYLALRADVTDREGSISSIISGGRWVRDDVHYEDA